MTELRYIFLLPEEINKLTGKLGVEYSKKFPSYFAMVGVGEKDEFGQFEKSKPLIKFNLK